MATTEELQARLKEAEDALHERMVSGQTTSVNTGGKSVSFANTPTAELVAYIASLKRQLGLPTGAARPIMPIYGRG